MKRKDTVLSIRISTADRDRIIAAAEEAGLSQSEFILRATLSGPLAERTLAERVDELEARLQRLEDRQHGWIAVGPDFRAETALTPSHLTPTT
jgi:uncharacterized protein (DUF1778 family)